MINIQLSDEDIVKLAKVLKKSEPSFTFGSLINIIVNVIFILTVLFMLGLVK